MNPLPTPRVGRGSWRRYNSSSGLFGVRSLVSSLSLSATSFDACKVSMFTTAGSTRRATSTNDADSASGARAAACTYSCATAGRPARIAPIPMPVSRETAASATIHIRSFRRIAVSASEVCLKDSNMIHHLKKVRRSLQPTDCARRGHLTQYSERWKEKLERRKGSLCIEKGRVKFQRSNASPSHPVSTGCPSTLIASAEPFERFPSSQQRKTVEMVREKLEAGAATRLKPGENESAKYLLRSRISRHGRSKTFRTFDSAARSIARTPSASANSSLIRLSTSIILPLSNSSAGAKRPQREPTTLISSTTMRAAFISVGPWKVDFKTSTPRGRSTSNASRKPEGDPEASTTRSNWRLRELVCSTVIVSRLRLAAV